jgi:hypothetical protein
MGQLSIFYGSIHRRLESRALKNWTVFSPEKFPFNSEFHE